MQCAFAVGQIGTMTLALQLEPSLQCHHADLLYHPNKAANKQREQHGNVTYTPTYMIADYSESCDAVAYFPSQ
eukprot:2125639-Amphidinium_carterae.1